jgi:hypothetical protein
MVEPAATALQSSPSSDTAVPGSAGDAEVNVGALDASVVDAAASTLEETPDAQAAAVTASASGDAAPQ